MTLAETKKMKLALIFDRKGSPGQFTRKFDDLQADEQRDLLKQTQLTSDELPVVASRRSSDSWVLITTDRVISSDSGNQCVIRHHEIEEVSPPKLNRVTEKLQWDELTIHSNKGARWVISVEPGPPLLGIWSLLLNLARSNRLRLIKRN